MPVFQYRARNRSQREIAGAITSDSPREARTTLRGQGLQVLEISERQEHPPRSARSSHPLWFRRDTRRVVSGLSELATLLSVGVPLMESLDTLLLQYHGSFATCLMQLRERVRSGSSLADAMRQQPRAFDELSIAMVEVGENAGNLDEVLRQYTAFQSKYQNFKDRVLSSLLYPAIVFLAAVLVAVFLMTIVVPMLLTNLARAGRTLPWPTRVLKTCSDVLLSHGWILASVILAAIVGAALAATTYAGRKALNRLVLSIPVIGEMARKQEISRVSLVISTLLGSGIELMRALEIARRASKSLLLREALSDCAKQIQTGRDLGLAVASNSFFPPVVVQVFTLGQKSGQLEQMLARLAADLDQQVETAAGRLSAVLEPALILALSIFIGFILFATLLPILEAGNVF